MSLNGNPPGTRNDTHHPPGREVYQELLVTKEEKKIFPKAVMHKTQVLGWALPTTIGANYSRKSH
jgi:hypothetical protein